MSKKKSENVEVTFTVPKEFHNILQLVARANGQTIEKFVIDELITGIDSELQEHHHISPGLWSLAGFQWEPEYADKLRTIAAGGVA